MKWVTKVTDKLHDQPKPRGDATGVVQESLEHVAVDGSVLEVPASAKGMRVSGVSRVQKKGAKTAVISPNG